MTDFFIALRLAWRSKFVHLGVWLALGLALICIAATQFSARQPATVGLDIGITFVRFVVPLFALLLVQELIGREFERRYSLVSLTYPRSRVRWLLGRVGALLAMSLGLTLLLAIVIVLSVSWATKGIPQGTPPSFGLPLVVTLAFFSIDLFVIAAVATAVAVFAVTPAFVTVGTLGFLLAARSYAPVLELLKEDGALVGKWVDADAYMQGLSYLNFLLPDLAALDVRPVALYGAFQFLPPHWPGILFATVVYGCMALSLAAWYLSKRDFS